MNTLIVDKFLIILVLILLILAISIFICAICTVYSKKITNHNKSITSGQFYDEYILPKKIYAYFDELQDSDIIKAHYENWKKKIPNWEIIFLDKKSVIPYLNNDGLKYFSGLKSVQFSDYLRLYLLKQYGGTWIDAGIIIFNGSFIDNYHNEMLQKKYDACLYEFSKKTINKNIPHLENWFIMAPKNSKFICDVFDEYTSALNQGFINYKKNILIPSGVDLTETIGNDIYSTYLIQHAIVNYLIHIGNKYNLNIKLAEESMFGYSHSFNWDHNQIINHILKNNNWNDLYAYKLIGATRKKIGNRRKEYIKKILSL